GGHGLCGDKELLDICGAGELKIPGKHNLENAMAAAAISYFAGIDPQVIGRGIRGFEGVEHRLEFVAEIGGVRFVNDSKGTNPDASIKALDAIPGGIVLIAGGYNKNASFEEFIGAFDGKVRGMILLGETAPIIMDAARKSGFYNSLVCKDMNECVLEAYSRAKSGDTVLLSPACASWDMYVNFEERGKHFKTCVKGLEK
ncbi:UDP-N-acetylmuramoyl-L-alanine--D-glutamate ligase, partial [bacterium]|nr:UDP-N-acetylmuramoyl-L-alanine--D-glutamate ligase [bacterium]